MLETRAFQLAMEIIKENQQPSEVLVSCPQQAAVFYASLAGTNRAFNELQVLTTALPEKREEEDKPYANITLPGMSEEEAAQIDFE